MKVALVSVTSAEQRQEFPARHWLSNARLGAYLLSVESDWQVRLRSYDDREDLAAVASKLSAEGFDVVGLPAYLWTRTWSQELAAELAALPAPPLIAAGGPETRAMDYLSWPDGTVFVQGQGERALLELCRARAGRPGFDGDDLPADGFDSCFSHARQRRPALPAETVRDRRLPHGVPLFGDRYLSMLDGDQEEPGVCWYETARGCIYSCSFCGHNTLPFFATFDTDFIRDELTGMRRRGIRQVFLVDPILGGKQQRGKDVVRSFTELAPEIGISAYMRPEFLDDEFVDVLAAADIVELLMGLQTTNPSVPKHVRGNNLEKIMKLVPHLAARGVPWRAELIVGLPGDDLAGLRESLRFTIDELRPTSVHAYHLTAIPETRLFDLLDRTEDEHWIRADERLRVVSASSYTDTELDEMLVYAGAVMSRHSYALDARPAAERTFAAVDAAARRLIETAGPTARAVFRGMDMTAGTALWDQYERQGLLHPAGW